MSGSVKAVSECQAWTGTWTESMMFAACGVLIGVGTCNALQRYSEPWDDVGSGQSADARVLAKLPRLGR